MACCCDPGCATRNGCTLSISWLGSTRSAPDLINPYSFDFSGNLPACPGGTFPFGSIGQVQLQVFCCDFPAEILFPWQSIRDACTAPATGKTYVALRLGQENPDISPSNPNNRNCGRFWLYSLPSLSGSELSSQSATLIADVVRVEFCAQVSWACQPYIYPGLPTPVISISCNPLP